MNESENCGLDTLEPGQEQIVYPGGNTGCIHDDYSPVGGGPFSFKVRRGTSNSKLMIYFVGGGACFFDINNKWVQACHDSGFVDAGVFSNQSDSPFANYTIVQVRYCSGDAFVGNVPVPGVGRQSGYNNSLKVLEWAQKAGFAQSLDSLIISGSSAGAIGAQMWARSWLKSFEHKSAAVIADSYVGVFPPDTQWRVFRSYGVCGEDESVLDSELKEACKNRTISLQLVVTNLLQAPNPPVLASIDSKRDIVQIGFYELIACNFKQLMKGPVKMEIDFLSQLNEIVANYSEESANSIDFIVDKNQHMFLDKEDVYEANTCAPTGGSCSDATKLIDWIGQVANGENPPSQCTSSLFSPCPRRPA